MPNKYNMRDSYKPIVIDNAENVFINNSDDSTSTLKPLDDFLEYQKKKEKDKIDYKDYLKQAQLPYVSRNDFSKTRETTPECFLTENQIVDDLVNNSDYNGLVIKGQGGIGKTRLMYEVAKILPKEHGYKAYVVSRSIAVGHLERFLSKKKKEKQTKYLFVFDYLEEFQREILEDFIMVAKNDRIRILANCRNTYNSNSFTHYIKIQCINNDDAIEEEYRRYTTKKIINPIITPLLEHKNQIFYKLKPSFAVFIRFLFDIKKTESDLLDFKDFKEWLQKRFKANLKLQDNESLKDYIKPLLLLPIYQNHHDKFHENSNSIRAFQNKYPFIGDLIENGWLEKFHNEDFTCLDTVHDTIKDELFLDYLTNSKKSLTNELINLLEFNQESLFKNLESNFFRAFERISDNEIFADNKFDFDTFFSKELFQDPGFELNTSSLFSLSITHLIDEERRFEIFEEQKKAFEAITTNMLFGWSLQNAINQYTKSEKKNLLPKNLGSLVDNWFDNNKKKLFDEKELAERFISTSIKLFPKNEKIKKYLLKYVKKAEKKNTELGSFILKIYLNSFTDVDTIQPHVFNYLEKNDQNEEARFVLSAWLNNKKTELNENITKHVLNYLEKNDQNDEAQFVLSAWLNNKKTELNENIKKHVLNYLEKNDQNEEARFVLSAWLNNKKTELNENITKHVLNYLEKNDQNDEAQFVLSAWLNNKKTELNENITKTYRNIS